MPTRITPRLARSHRHVASPVGTLLPHAAAAPAMPVVAAARSCDERNFSTHEFAAAKYHRLVAGALEAGGR